MHAPIKRKRLNVVPGRSVAAHDTPDKENSLEVGPSTSAVNSKAVETISI